MQDFYKVGKTLGEGSFAVVRDVTCLKDNSQWAAKCIDKKNLSKTDEESLQVEVDIMGKLDHPCVVHLREVFDSNRTFYMILENCSGGEMFDRIVEKEKYTEHEARVAFFQIIKALEYCHQQGIVHRDLKPENLLYSDKTEDATLKVADFGLARLFTNEQSIQLMTTMCGTPGYVAPEILKNENYGSSVDIWSAAVILYILLCGYPPFYDDNNAALFRQIKSGSYDFPNEEWDAVSNEAKDLIEKMLVVSPSERLDIAAILKHPWMEKEDLQDRVLNKSLDQMKKFNARRKFKAGVMVARIAKNLQAFKK
jgi:calcium/calmodulin-dependent protein kinase I